MSSSCDLAGQRSQWSVRRIKARVVILPYAHRAKPAAKPGNDKPRVSLTALSGLPLLVRTVALRIGSIEPLEACPKAASSATLPLVAALPLASVLRVPVGGPKSAPVLRFPPGCISAPARVPPGPVRLATEAASLIGAQPLPPRSYRSSAVGRSFPSPSGPDTEVPVPVVQVRRPVGSPLPAPRSVRCLRTGRKINRHQNIASH